MSFHAAARAVTTPAYPCLPEGLSLGGLIELIERIGRRCGLGAPREKALIRMIRSTASRDWTEADHDPVCYRRQTDLAKELGITERAMRAHEAALERLGFLRIETGANGRRSGRELTGGKRLGLNFRPLIERIGDLLAIDAQIRDDAERRIDLCLECSAAKRDVKQALDRLTAVDPDCGAIAELRDRYASWPQRYAGLRNIDAVAAHLAEIESVLSDALDLLSCRKETSGVAESGIPPIQNTNLNISESCSGSSAVTWPSRLRDDSKSFTPGPDGPDECREKIIGARGEDDNPNDISWLTPDLVRDMAGPDFRYWLDSITDGGEMTERALRSAAIGLRGDLGISPSAWEEAMEVFGSLRASLVVMVIDANRQRPIGPIHSPGGALRAFTRLQRAGQFNLPGSLMGVLNWKRNMS